MKTKALPQRTLIDLQWQAPGLNEPPAPNPSPRGGGGLVWRVFRVGLDCGIHFRPDSIALEARHRTLNRTVVGMSPGSIFRLVLVLKIRLVARAAQRMQRRK